MPFTFLSVFLERGRVLAPVASVRVIGARRGDHLHDGGEGTAAVAACVTRLGAALVEFVRASVGAVRMIGTGGGDELTHIVELASAVFAVNHSTVKVKN